MRRKLISVTIGAALTLGLLEIGLALAYGGFAHLQARRNRALIEGGEREIRIAFLERLLTGLEQRPDPRGEIAQVVREDAGPIVAGEVGQVRETAGEVADPLRVLDQAHQNQAGDEILLRVDAEVLQEILHRYRAIRRWKVGVRVFDLARRIVPDVIPVDAEVLEEARRLLDSYPDLTARDALHAAVVCRSGAEAICSYDRDFDSVEGVTRREPGDLLG